MEWYVLNYDFNKKKVETFNIFRNAVFVKNVQELVNNYLTFDDFVEKLKSEIKYNFWSRREYEISVGDAFCKEEELEKWDIANQVLPNIEILANYIINYYNQENDLKN